MLSPPFQYLERLFSRNSPFSKGAQAYFAFLEREKENEHEDYLRTFRGENVNDIFEYYEKISFTKGDKKYGI